MLATEDGDAKIRINMYNIPGRVYTANCVRLVSVNNYAQSGVVHMLDGVMKPATQTIAQLLSSEGFSSFQKREYLLYNYDCFSKSLLVFGYELV